MGRNIQDEVFYFLIHRCVERCESESGNCVDGHSDAGPAAK